MNVGYIETKSGLVVFLGGEAITVPVDAGSTREILLAVESGASADTIRALIQKVTAGGRLAAASTEGGEIILNGNTVSYRPAPGAELEVLPDSLAARIRRCVEQRSPLTAIGNFVAKLFKNPSRRARQELYTFLVHEAMPITPAGTFLAYKAVQADWTDKRTGTVSNHIGAQPTMPRRDVCDDANVGCSAGFHAGSLKYATDFAGPGDRVVIVEIDPANVVSIPTDCGFQKLRCNTYKVIDIYRGPMPESCARGGVGGGYAPVREEDEEWGDGDDEDIDSAMHEELDTIECAVGNIRSMIE